MRPWPLALLLIACKDAPEDTGPPVEVGDGVFAEGCPREGRALARVIGVDARLPGKAAVGTRGDLLLANAVAAFVITEPDKGSTYYHYGGIVADAAPMDGCAPGEDKLDEVGLLLGQLDLGAWNNSILRGFRGQSVEVLADGSDGGPATVRVTGTDDMYWLVEYELIRSSVSSGGRPLSDPFGLEVEVDYTLTPDSPVLQVDIRVRNPGDQTLSLVTPALLSFGETLDVYTYATGELSISRLNLDLGIPWLLATDGQGALAWAVEGGSLAYAGVSGVQVAIDAFQATSRPLALPPGGEDVATAFLSVGATDGASATAPLAAFNPEPVPGQRYTLAEVTGQVVDPSGAPAAGVFIDLEAATATTDWGVLDQAVSDADGRFVVPVPAFGTPWDYRLVPHGAGRDAGGAVEVDPGAEVTLTVGAAGALAVTIVDQDGAPSPARLHLEREDGRVEHRWLVDGETTPLAPGRYVVTATRGYEYAPVYAEVEVPAGEAALELVMDHVVDTTGYLSVDTHVHTSDSSDSRMGQAAQLQHAAAHGLEVVVHTEHEAIVDRSMVPVEAGLAGWVTNVIGEEVTATIPEHLTMFPAVPDGSVRGGVVRWYGQDLDQLFAAMRERSGGGVNLLNHPSYLDLVGWDRLLAEPTLDDPTLLGLAPDAALWSWNMDGMEVMNGHGDVFISGNRRFDNWQSMVNAGHPMVAVGCSDDHGGDEVGFPRSYFASTSDDVADFSEQELVDAFHGGDIIASNGAFARVVVGGGAPGELVTATDGAVEVSLTVEAIPEIDVTHAVVFVNCDQVARLPADNPNGIVKLSTTLEVPVAGDSQVVVAAFGEGYLPAGLPRFNPARRPRVLVNPVYVDGDGDGAWSAPGSRECSYDVD